tara:strand:- start:116 stop:994 length:879 start_codon:yes stop_codon:yes gene_type:complete
VCTIPAHHAAKRGHEGCLRTLHVLGGDAAASLVTVDTNGLAPSHIAALFGQEGCLRVLHELGGDAAASLAAVFSGGFTPLLLACQKGCTKAVSLLLKAGVAVDQASDTGATPLYVACQQGHIPCAQQLSSYGAARSFQLPPPANTTISVSGAAAHGGHDALVAWLATSSQWSTAPHHLTVIDATRARALLRAGADLEAAAQAGGPTPISLARAQLHAQAGGAGAVTAASLVLDAARPWSRRTHELFPAAARARAVELLLLGHCLSRESFFVGAEVSLLDAWMESVLPQAVLR